MTLDGTVKMFVSNKGYGFVTPADGSKDVYFAQSAVEGGVGLEVGQAVEYRLAENPRIPQAEWVRPRSASPAKP